MKSNPILTLRVDLSLWSEIIRGNNAITLGSCADRSSLAARFLGNFNRV